MIEPKRYEPIRKGDYEQLWSSRDGKFIKVKVVKEDFNFVVVEMSDKKMWTISRTDYLSMREIGRREKLVG